MQFGFAATATPATVTFQFLGTGDAGELGPNLYFHRADDGSACALAGRLHYRGDALASVAGRVPPALTDASKINDAALAGALYRASGAAGLVRLEGDFALVVWDARRRRLIGRRDPFGAYPLFWVVTGAAVAFGTGLRPLLDLLPRCTVNLEHIADFVMLPLMGSEPASERCAYCDVQRVQPEIVVSLDVETGNVARETCWNWTSRIVDPGTGRLDELAPRYRELLQAAVRTRLGRPTSAQLSGGMDSTSVMALALEEIREGHGEGPLHAVSLAYDRLATLRLERPYIELALAIDPQRTVTHRIVADELLFYDNHASLPVHEEPLAGLWNAHTEIAMIDTAVAAGATALLTGQGGDDLLDMLPFHLADTIRRGRLVAAWREACAWAHGRGSTPWRILQLCALPDLRNRIHHNRFGRRLLSSRGEELRDGGDWIVPDWIEPGFASRHALRDRAADADASVRRLATAPRLALALSTIARRVGNVVGPMLAAPRGISLSHPFLDPRVTGFALGLQERFRPDPSTVKPVLAAAMQGRLPEAIRTRRDKRSFNETYYIGLSRNVGGIRRLIERAPADGFGIIRKSTLLASIEEAALGIGDARGHYRFDTALSTLVWLSNERDWRQRPIPWSREITWPLAAA